MTLRFLRFIDLPENKGKGGFDHAHIHHAHNRLYVAHTCNDAVDVIDLATDQYLFSIPNLAGVAGALVSDTHDLVFTSNRAENTLGVFAANDSPTVTKIGVGVKPNGLSYDPVRNRVLSAHVGDPDVPSSYTVSLVDVAAQKRIADIPVAGRTRWTVFDPQTDAHYVNIADPAQIAVIDAKHPTQVARTFAIPVAGPHGLDLDAENRRLFCACDGGQLVCVDIHTGAITQTSTLSGVPDVIFFDAALRHLHVAIGEPGLIEVFDTTTMTCVQRVQTELGAHTFALDMQRHKVYVFLPQSHRAAVYEDRAMNLQ